MEDADRRVEEQRTRIKAEYREVLRNSVAFEKRIRNRWREKNRLKNARISELEARVKQLERELEVLKRDPPRR
jgi:polyhydroxyalkanoate synthesis regulator phasin